MSLEMSLEQNYAEIMEAVRASEAAEVSKIKEAYALTETGLLELTRIGEAGEYSYGDAAEMAKTLDSQLGSSPLGDSVTRGIAAARNLLDLCGYDFSQSELAREYIFQESELNNDYYLTNDLPGITNRIPLLLGRVSEGNVQAEYSEFKENPMSVNEIAEKLDHGYRGLLVHNSGLIHGSAEYGQTLAGKIAEVIPGVDRHFETHHADHVVTFETAVRDKEGAVQGFYVCDTASGNTQEYVRAEDLMASLDVNNGGLIFTEKPYL